MQNTKKENQKKSFPKGNQNIYIPKENLKGNPKGNVQGIFIRSQKKKSFEMDPQKSSHISARPQKKWKNVLQKAKCFRTPLVHTKHFDFDPKSEPSNKKMVEVFPGFKGNFEESDRFKKFITDKLVTLVKNKKSNFNNTKEKKEKNSSIKKSLFNSVSADLRKKIKQGRFSLETSWKSKNRKKKKPFYTKFVNLLMIHGNKTKAHKIFAKTLNLLQTKVQQKKTNKLNPIHFIIKGVYKSIDFPFSYKKSLFFEKKKKILQVVIKTSLNKKNNFFWRDIQEKRTIKKRFFHSHLLRTSGLKTKPFLNTKTKFLCSTKGVVKVFVQRGFYFPSLKQSLCFNVSKKPKFSRNKKPEFSRFFCWFIYKVKKKNAKKKSKNSFERSNREKRLEFSVNQDYTNTSSSKICFLPQNRDIQSILKKKKNQINIFKFHYYSQKYLHFQKNQNKLRNRKFREHIQKIVSKKKQPFSRLPCYRRGFYFPSLKYLKRKSPKFPQSGTLFSHSTDKKKKHNLNHLKVQSKLVVNKTLVGEHGRVHTKPKVLNTKMKFLCTSKPFLFVFCDFFCQANKNSYKYGDKNSYKYGDKNVNGVVEDISRFGKQMKFTHLSPKKKPAPEKTQLDVKIKQKIQKDRKTPLDLVIKAVEYVQPYVEVRKVKRGKRFYQVPSCIRAVKRERLAISWLIDSAKKRQKTGISFSKSLALEVLEALKKQGKPRQKRNDLHKVAKLNRDKFRYSWW